MSKSLKLVFAAALMLSVVGVARGESYDTSSYVQEGLIAHWDACENAGYQKYDATSATWKDLTGKHADLVFPNGCVMGKDANTVSYYNLAKDAQGKDHGCYLTSCADIAQAIIDKACTVEIVCDFASKVNDGTLMACVDGNNNRILWARSYSGAPDGCLATLEYLATSAYAYPDVDGNTLNQIRGYSFVCGATKCDIYKNGETTGKSVACKNVSCTASSAWLSFGCRRSQSATSAATADMKIYAVRIYNRVLTDEELAANAKIDQTRLFEGQYVGDHLLEIESNLEAIGEPTPAYGRYLCTPGEATTCTAPASVETEAATYTCCGYQLYTNTLEDANCWFPWDGPQTGTSATFVFPDTGSVKLVWRWSGVLKESLQATLRKTFVAGKDAMCFAYEIDDFEKLGDVGVNLRYGASPEQLDGFVVGGVITTGGSHGEVFRGFDPGRRYWGQLVFTLGESVISETAVFKFSMGDNRLVYWPFNSRTYAVTTVGDGYFRDQSGCAQSLYVDKTHVTRVPDAAAPDGEYVHLDGEKSFLKTWEKLYLSGAEGLTVAFRMRGIRNVDPNAVSASIFETSPDYNSTVGAIHAHAERKDDGKWYLYVGEKGKDGYAYCRSTTPLDELDWQTVVIAFTKQDAPDCFAVYVNGVRQTLECEDGNDKSMKDQPYADEFLYLGGRGGAGTTVGDFDEFGIYGYAFDAGEVAQLTADLSGVGGTLLVETSDVGTDQCRPALGAHSCYVAGQVVSFDRADEAGATRVWSLQAYDEERGEWAEVKRGYGHCGTFTHTGGKMRLFWDVDLRLQPVCRWSFDDGTGRNDGTLGADLDLVLSGSAAAESGYLSVPKDASAFAGTKSALPLASAEGVTVSGWVRNPSRRLTGVLFELSENYGIVNGCWLVSYNSETHHWELGMRDDNRYSVVGCDFSAEDDMMLDGQWHYCTFVYRKAAWPNLDLYIDGVQMSVNDGGYNYKNDTTGFKFANDQKFYLCHRGTENSQQADLDNVAVHSCALTPAEVVALYANEPRATSIPAMPEGTATLLVTAKKAVPTEDLPIPGFGKTCACTAGEKLSFDFTHAPYSVEGRTGKFKLMSWKLYRYVDGEWKVYQMGANPLVEFVHPGGAVKLELNFGIPGLVVFFM